MPTSRKTSSAANTSSPTPALSRQLLLRSAIAAVGVVIPSEPSLAGISAQATG